MKYYIGAIIEISTDEDERVQEGDNFTVCARFEAMELERNVSVNLIIEENSIGMQ